MSYRLHFIDSGKFMVSSLSNLVNNISEGIHKIKCKYRHDDKNVKLAELDINIGTVFCLFVCFFFEFTNFRNDVIEHKCLCCIKNYK